MTIPSCNRNTYEGYAAVFDIIDKDNDIIAKTAFDWTLKNITFIPLLKEHNTSWVIDIVDKICLDDFGLKIYFESKLDCCELFNGLSFGYRVNKKHFLKNGTRVIEDLTLIEFSLVKVPMQPLSKFSCLAPSDT
jgi:uncharacterized protein